MSELYYIYPYIMNMLFIPNISKDLILQFILTYYFDILKYYPNILVGGERPAPSLG